MSIVWKAPFMYHTALISGGETLIAASNGDPWLRRVIAPNLLDYFSLLFSLNYLNVCYMQRREMTSVHLLSQILNYSLLVKNSIKTETLL